MLKFIDKDYMSVEYGLIEFQDEKKADYYIGRASRKISQLITIGKFNEDDITNLTQKQQEAIKEATAIYTDYYWKDDFDFTEGSISISMGGQSFSESRQYKGEKVIPQTLELLENNDLLETDFGSGIILVDEIEEDVRFYDPNNPQQYLDSSKVDEANTKIKGGI